MFLLADKKTQKSWNEKSDSFIVRLQFPNEFLKYLVHEIIIHIILQKSVLIGFTDHNVPTS